MEISCFPSRSKCDWEIVILTSFSFMKFFVTGKSVNIDEFKSMKLQWLVDCNSEEI